MEENRFPKYTFKNRLKSMLKVDFKRMFISPFYYIMLGISIVIPILVIVMTTMMAGTERVDPVTNEVTIMEQMFTNAWQSIGSLPSSSSDLMMLDITTMCNINMMYFAIAVLVCIFVSDDFRSGYNKCLFTIRSNKVDYVISKTVVCFVAGATIILGYFIGAMLASAISSLSFTMDGFNLINVIFCMLSKLILVLVFVPIYLVMSVIGKSKTWLSMILAFGVSMLLFMMIPSLTPLNSTFMNVILSLMGGLLFSIGIGAISNIVLKKTSLV